MSVEEVMNIAEKDAVFYHESAGGVTLSGGEPLYQIDFTEDLISSLKRKGYHITIDTSGYATRASFMRIVNNTDLFFYDIKLIDDKDHQQYTGVANDVILQNLMWLAREGKKIILRFPVVPGITDTKKNINGLMTLLFQMKEFVSEIDLLPYHSMARQKYKQLNRDDRLENLKDVSREELTELKNEIAKTGFIVKIGG